MKKGNIMFKNEKRRLYLILFWVLHAFYFYIGTSCSQCVFDLYKSCSGHPRPDSPVFCPSYKLIGMIALLSGKDRSTRTEITSKISRRSGKRPSNGSTNATFILGWKLMACSRRFLTIYSELR